MFKQRKACGSNRRLESGVTLAVLGALCMGLGATESQGRTDEVSPSAGAPSQSESGGDAETGGLSRIEPRADRVLRAMSDYLKSAKQFAFHADIAYDSVIGGQKIQFGGAVDIVMRRPDRLRSEFRGDERQTSAIINGSTCTLHDLQAGVYSIMEVPPGLEAAIDHLVEKYGLSVPIADLLYDDVYASLSEHVLSGYWVGRHSVDGTPCDHLAFAQDGIDWQIWIEAGPVPVPRKFVITHMEEPLAPQYTARLSGWDFQSRASDAWFVFKPPVGADEIEFLPAQEREATEKEEDR